MVTLPELKNEQLLYLQTIFDYFHIHGTWPTYGYLEREITRSHRDFDMRRIAENLPSGFGNAFTFYIDRMQEAVLKIPAILLCKGSKHEVADFVQVLQYCVEKYFRFEENNLQVTSDEVKANLKMSELAIRKVGRLIEAEGTFWSSLGRNDVEGSWVCALTPGKEGIARFDKVESIEQYIEKLDPVRKSFVMPSLSQLSEDTDTLSSGKLERLLADIGYSYVETSPLEIKENIPSAKELACLMAAFANTDGGGVIIIGMTDNFKIVGVPDDAPLESLYIEAFSSLSPHPLMNYRFATIKGMQIFIITVQKYPTPILTEDQRYYVTTSRISLPEEDLIDALSESVPSFKTNILSSIEKPHAEASKDIGSLSRNVSVRSANIFSGTIGDIAGGAVNTIVHESIVQKPGLDFNELLKDTIERTRDGLTTQRKERLQQARITFIVALVVLILAIIFVFIGVILIFSNKIQAGVVSSIASIVSGIVSGLALTFNKQTNDRLDEYARELVALEKSYTGMQYLSLITDIKMKDEAICDLAKGISLGNRVNK